MNQDWFEMPEIRRKFFSNTVWVPLRAIHTISETGSYGFLGYTEEFFGVGTLAVPISNREEAKKLGWDDIGISGHHSGYIQDNEYIPVTSYAHFNNNYFGEHLILEQRINSIEKKVWHINQDLITTLGLMREGDNWLRPEEGYIEIAKLYRNKNGHPYKIEIRASHLRDYLCARKMALYLTSYRSRKEIISDASDITWQENPHCINTETDRWEGRVDAIHEGGMLFGEKTAVFHLGRIDENLQDDVPELSPVSDKNTTSTSWVKEETGKKLYRVEGELWRNEWLEPAANSPLIRGDKTEPTVFFITSIEGHQENKETLINSDKWLWFNSSIVNALMNYRGSELKWHTRDTASISCSPGWRIPFGVNSIGLITVYAKDIGLLPDWQQKIWAGHNVSPDGGVSSELLDSQMSANPANTQAPEKYLDNGLKQLNAISNQELNVSLLKHHDDILNLLKKSHRFRATDKSGLYSLAKDIARLTADSIDSSAIKKIVPIQKDERLGSLKLLEKLVAINIDPAKARDLLTPLVGAYELRNADAHLPSSEIDEALKLVKVDKNATFMEQGYQLLHSCVSSIYGICAALNGISKKIK